MPRVEFLLVPFLEVATMSAHELARWTKVLIAAYVRRGACSVQEVFICELVS
jgi:hypothetical protein